MSRHKKPTPAQPTGVGQQRRSTMPPPPVLDVQGSSSGATFKATSSLDVYADMGDSVEGLGAPAWMSSQIGAIHTVFGAKAGGNTFRAPLPPKPKASASTLAFPPSTQVAAKDSVVYDAGSEQPATAPRSLSRTSSRSSVTSTSASTSGADPHPRPPSAPLDDLVQRVRSHSISAMCNVDARILRHCAQSGISLTTMKARALDLGFTVDRHGRLVGQRQGAKGKGKGKAAEEDSGKEQREEQPMEVDSDLPPPRSKPPSKKASRADATSIPTPAPSRTPSLTKAVGPLAPKPPAPGPIAPKHPAPASPLPAEPHNKRRRVDTDENVGYHAAPTSHNPLLSQPALSQPTGKRLGMLRSRRGQSEKPEAVTGAKAPNRAHPLPFRPPLRASQNTNTAGNRVPQTTHPPGHQAKPASPVKRMTSPVKGGASASKSSAFAGRNGALKTKGPASPVKASGKTRSSNPTVMDEVPDSEDEDGPPDVTRKREPSPVAADADSSFDYDANGMALDDDFLRELNEKGLP
ncbi:hypothetical protein HDZ31DRAFT_61396 [Schizophyllum fasciatum]